MSIVLILLIFYLCYLLLSADSKPHRLNFLSINQRFLLSTNIIIAKSWTNRRLGLLNHSSFSAGQGLLLLKTRKVHTVGMLFPLDLVFLNVENRVLEIRENVGVNQAEIKGPKQTKSVLELSSGSAVSHFKLDVGDKLGFQPCLD